MHSSVNPRELSKAGCNDSVLQDIQQQKICVHSSVHTLGMYLSGAVKLIDYVESFCVICPRRIVHFLMYMQ